MRHKLAATTKEGEAIGQLKEDLELRGATFGHCLAYKEQNGATRQFQAEIWAS